MMHQPHNLMKKDSLFDLDNFWPSGLAGRDCDALQLIDCQMDFPLVSSDGLLYSCTNQDLLGCQLEEIAFGNRQLGFRELACPPICPSEKSMEQEDLSTSVHSEVVLSPEVQPVASKKTGCNCKKTGCLKMYCECFSSGKLCTSDCNCCNCSNCVEQLGKVEKAKEQAKQRHKHAQYDAVDGGILRHCNCRKTQCQKKYCECYNAGRKCTQKCKCEDCLNGTHSPSDHEEQQLAQKLIF